MNIYPFDLVTIIILVNNQKQINGEKYRVPYTKYNEIKKKKMLTMLTFKQKYIIKKLKFFAIIILVEK